MANRTAQKILRAAGVPQYAWSHTKAHISRRTLAAVPPSIEALFEWTEDDGRIHSRPARLMSDIEIDAIVTYLGPQEVSVRGPLH